MLKSFSWFVQPELIGTAKVRPEICCADFRVNAASIKQCSHRNRGSMAGDDEPWNVSGLAARDIFGPLDLNRQSGHTTEKTTVHCSGSVHWKEQGGTIYAERTEGIDLELCVKISWICRNAYTSCLDAAKDAGLRSVAWFDGSRWAEELNSKVSRIDHEDKVIQSVLDCVPS